MLSWVLLIFKIVFGVPETAKRGHMENHEKPDLALFGRIFENPGGFASYDFHAGDRGSNPLGDAKIRW